MSKSAKKRVGESRGEKKRKAADKSRQTGLVILVIVIVAIVAASAIVYIHGSSVRDSTSVTTAQTVTINNPSNKPMILYVNQGNAVVNRSNFPALLSFAKSEHFNTLFFQVYRSGQLLFSSNDLSYFVESAHLNSLNLYFSLYFTDASQIIPTSIYNLGENGISLDMSTLPGSAQGNLLATLKLDMKNGTTAVTTTNLTSTLKPDLLVLETYNFQSDEQFIHSGIVASVEPLAIPTIREYQQEVNYALTNSSGVMVFDYYGLLQKGY